MTYASIPTAQIVDYLYKKVGYGVAKTDANSRPAASEGNASPFLTLGSALYQLDYAIPKYSSFAAMITGGNIVTTANPTTGLPGGLTISTVATVQASAIAGSVTGATWQTNLYNWIPVPVGGQGYQVGVFAGPAGLAISSLQGSGANANGPPGTVAVPINGVANDSWYFDYQSGILNFPDQIVPTTVSNVSNVIYITGAVYSGYTGITNWANLSVTGNINSTSGNINLTNGNIYAQNYFGTFQGTIGGGTSIALANVANYEVMTPVSTSSNIFYPKLSNIVAAGNSITGVSTSLSFVPSTGTLTATAFSGTLSATNVSGTVATANASIYTGVTNTASGTYYPVLSAQSTTGNAQAAASSSLSYNAATGALTATSFAGYGGALTGTMSTANVALYEQITNLTNNQTYYLGFANVVTGNSTLGAVTSVNVNPSTGQVNSVSANVTTLNVGSTSILAGQVQITNAAASTTYGSGALVVAGGLGVAGAAFFNSNVSIAGNLVVTGNNISLGATTLSVTDPIINLNSPQDLTPLTVPTTADIGLKFHYYDTADSAGFAGRTVVDGYFTYWAKGTDTANVFTGTVLGTVKGGGLIVANARVVAGGLSANTGSMQVWGDASITGNLYVGNGLQNTPIGTLGSSTGNFTTVTAQTVNAATIGNSGASIVGTISATGVSGTVTTANAAIYTGITNTATGTYYPVLSAQNTTGNAQAAASSSLSYNAATGALTATSFSGTVSATNVSGTVATANVALYEQVQNYTTGTFYPTFSNTSTSTGNTTIGVNSSLTYNAATGALTATSFSGYGGALTGTMATANASIYTGVTNTNTGTYYPLLSAQNTTGNAQAAANSSLSYNAATGALTATSFSGTVGATNVSGTVATANVALYEQVNNWTTGTFYPTFSNTSTTAGNTVIGVNSSLSYNAATGALTATSFSGTLSATNLSGTAATANVSLYDSVTAYTTNQTFYPVFSNTSSSGNTVAGVATNLSFNPSSGTLSATVLSGTVSALNVSGTVATANVALYASATPYTTNQTFYPVFSNVSAAGNTTVGVNSGLSYNPSTGTLTATNFAGAMSGTIGTANVALYDSVTAFTTNQTFYPQFSNIATTGNSVTGVATNLSFNPATGLLTTTTFSGAGTLTTLSTSGVASLGANVVINNGSNTNDNVSGGLVIKGTAGAAIGGNINVGAAMFIGSGAQSTVLNSPIAIKRGTPGVAPGFQYLQDALISATNYGSSDFIAYGNNYTGVASDHGFMDMGFTGDAFTDPYYSLTKSNDGYVFASGANATVGGNLVLSTDWSGSYNDIVLGVGSFYANAEVARFHGNTSNSGTFVLKLPTNASPAANTGAFQVWGGASFAGNTYHGGATVFNGSQTAGQDFVVRGRNDATLIWARPNATYDSVIIGNSATASTAVNGAKLVINTNDSIMLPVGSNAQRPTASGLGTDTAGMFRYSSTSSSVEWYNGTSWQSAGTTFTVIVDQQFTGTNSQTAFTLSQTATTAGVIVSINGVLQIPTLAYSVSGTTLTFTEAPLTTDVIDVRLLTTTSTVTSISSTTGKAQVLVDDTTGIYFQSSNTAGTTVLTIPIGGGIVSNDANVSVASANTLTTLDTVPNGTYRSAKYIIQVTNGTNFQTMEALMVQNGTTATITTYGVVQTNGNLGILSATVSSSNTLVQFVAANATNNVRTFRQYMPI